MLKRIKIFVFSWVVLSFFLSSCVGNNRYTVQQIREEADFDEKYAAKKVNVQKQNSETIIGYFLEFRNDSIVISLDRNKKRRLVISNEEIKSIQIIDDDHHVIFALMLVALIFIVLSAPGTVVPQ